MKVRMIYIAMDMWFCLIINMNSNVNWICSLGYLEHGDEK